MTRVRSFATVALILTLAHAAGGCARFAAGPTERPGLGTAWGETRESRVRDAAFEREDPARPAAVATLRYDDRAGLQAMTGGLPPFLEDEGGALVAGGALRVRLLDGGGEPLRLYRLGADRYVEGHDGQRYTIEIQNRSGARFEAVATVDGLDVLDGERGSFHKRGYLVEPWGTLRIDGFRRNLDEVAAFRFGSVSESYAARKGDDADVGVIGVAFFGERGARAPWLDREAERRQSATPFRDVRFAEPPPRRYW